MHRFHCLVSSVLFFTSAVALAQEIPQTLEPYPLQTQVEQSLADLAADSDVLILGETHGMQEVPQIAAALLAPLSKLGYGVLALEIPADQQQPLTDWATGKTTQVPPFFTKRLEFEDGRASIQALALIRTALAPPYQWKLICFDSPWPEFAYSLPPASLPPAAASPQPPPTQEQPIDPFAAAMQRDAHMATALAKQRTLLAPDAKVLAICGNLHARIANNSPPDDLFSKLWPSFAAALQKDQPTWRVHSINVIAHGGAHFATIDNDDGKPSRTGVHPIRSKRKITEAEAHRLDAAAWNWELNLPKATAATFLDFTNAGEAPKPSAPRQQGPQNTELRRELLERTKKDQEARNAWIKWTKEHGEAIAGTVNSKDFTPQQQAEFEKIHVVTKIDEENTKWLKEIVDQHGWPTISLVGQDGANAAWLLVQHADRDPKFQRQCLDLMTALPKEEVSQRDLAYLTDRVLLKEGKPQLYGTQFTSENGQWKPQPLEDESNVDARRASVGLPPLAEYAKQLAEVYGPATAK